ncbi:MAG: glycoside hydrolase family 18 protein [Anaplasmataceae bacterium]|nr:glycoside hydrolase family 18 protein [Anaplasmataceae bacterium]
MSNNDFHLGAYFGSWSSYRQPVRDDQIADKIGGYQALPGYTQNTAVDPANPHKEAFLQANAVKNGQLSELVDDIYYGFLQAHADQPTSKNYGTVVNNNEYGKLFFQDPWSDLTGSDCNMVQQNEFLMPSTQRNVLESNVCPWGMKYNFFGAAMKLGIDGKIIAVGGYGDEYTKHWETAARYPDNFVSSIKTIKHYYPDIKGIDLDWEPISLVDPAKIISLTKAIKEEMGDDFHVSFPIGVNTDQLRNFGQANWVELSKYVDQFNLMDYDIHGYFDKGDGAKTGLHTQLYRANASEKFSVDDQVSLLESYGIPDSKMSLGLATYGRGMSGVTGEGIGQVFDHKYMGDMDLKATPWYETSIESNVEIQGVSSYQWINYALTHNLARAQNIEQHDVTVNHDGKNVVIGSYVNFDDSGYGKTFMSYDSPAAIEAKVEYAYDKGMAGVFFWSLETDSVINDHSLIKTAYDKIHELSSVKSVISPVSAGDTSVNFGNYPSIRSQDSIDVFNGHVGFPGSHMSWGHDTKNTETMDISQDSFEYNPDNPAVIMNNKGNINIYFNNDSAINEYPIENLLIA